jgi:hypothetical protein
MLRVGSIVIRVDDLPRQAAFWTAALNSVPREGDGDDFVLLRPSDGAGPNVSLDRVNSTVQVPPPDADCVILADPEGNRFCVVDASQ